METPAPKEKSSTKWIRRIFIIIAFVVIIPVGMFTIGWLNRDTVIDLIQEWYSQNNNGTLTIGKVNANFIRGFPEIGFTLKDIKQTDQDTITKRVSSVSIEEAKVTIGAGNLLKGNLQFKKINITNAIISSEVISDKSYEYHVQLKLDKQANGRKKFELPSWINSNGAKFSFENVKFISKDTILHKYFNLDIHKIEGEFTRSEAIISGDLIFDVTANNLGFNTRKGSFFNGARVMGSPSFRFIMDKDEISIPEFALAIDNETFQLQADFNVYETTEYTFNLKNSSTDLTHVKKLLADSISEKLKSYEILKPFESNLSLNGKFQFGNNPDIRADFFSEGNELVIADSTHLTNVNFRGHLTNGLYELDSLKDNKKSRKDIKLYFEELTANIEDIDIKIKDSYFQSTPEALNYIKADLSVNGSNETLAEVIRNKNFDFIGGTFNLNAEIDGDIDILHQIFNHAQGKFLLNNTSVVLKKNGLRLPIGVIELTLDKETSKLNQLLINLPNGDNLVLTGKIENVSSLLSSDPVLQTKSSVSLISNELNIDRLISTAKQFLPSTTTITEDRKNFHETLETIYLNFRPQFNLDLESLSYDGLVLSDVDASIGLANPETITLENFNFKYLDAVTNLKGSLRVPDPKNKFRDPIFINAAASSTGPLQVLKELFNIELFRIDSGDFNFKGEVSGNLQRLEQLMENAKGELYLTDTKMHYSPTDLDVELDSVILFVDNSDVFLRKFELGVGENHPIELNGKIENYPGFLLDKIESDGSMSLRINAPFIDTDRLLATINSFQNSEEPNDVEERKRLHTVFKDLYDFHPEIELSIDSLKYNDLVTKDILAQVNFENDSILKLHKLELNYKDTKAVITGEVNAHDSRRALRNDNPFEFNFKVNVKGKTKDLNDYLQTVNFVFSSGEFEFNGNYNGQSDDIDVLTSEAFGDLKIGSSVVDIRAADLQIPVDSLHIEIENDLAKLKKLDLNLPGKSSVLLSGTIDNFSSFINNLEDKEAHNSHFSIYSPYLATSDIIEFLGSSGSSSKDSTSNNLDLQKLKNVLVNINRSYYPTVGIKIDSLNYKNLDFTNFGSNISFGPENNIQLGDTKLFFYGGSLSLNIDAAISTKENLPVTLKMEGKDMDVHELVSKMNYFKDEDLKKADKIEGMLDYELLAEGLLDNEGKLIMDSLNGTLKFKVEDLAIFNYKPIMENVVLLKDERFKHLRFRPIEQTFTIKNGEIIIPRTEIQSSAIHVFAEGRLKIDEYINIWLALPWKNLKKRDGMSLPEKISYDEAGSKFYIQLVQDKKSDKAREQKFKVKFKLGKRKLRELQKELN